MKISHLMYEGYLYRGLSFSSNIAPDSVTDIADGSEPRTPRNTSLIVHQMINALSTQRFDVAIRDLPFYYKSITYTTYYGSVYTTSPDTSMRYFYAPDINDLTRDKNTGQYGRIDPIKFYNRDIMRVAEQAIKNMSDDNENIFYDVVTEFFHTFNTAELTPIYTVNDIHRNFHEVGEAIYKLCDDKNFKDEYIIEIIINALKEYFSDIFEYVENVKVTKDYNNVPNNVEIMLYSKNIVFLKKYQSKDIKRS